MDVRLLAATIFATIPSIIMTRLMLILNQQMPRIRKMKWKLIFAFRLLIFQTKIFFNFVTGNCDDLHLSMRKTTYRLDTNGHETATRRGQYRQLTVNEFNVLTYESNRRRLNTGLIVEDDGSIPRNFSISRTRSGCIYNCTR